MFLLRPRKIIGAARLTLQTWNFGCLRFFLIYFFLSFFFANTKKSTKKSRTNQKNEKIYKKNQKHDFFSNKQSQQIKT